MDANIGPSNINYVTIAKRFEQELTTTQSDKKEIDDAVKNLISNSKTFDQLDPHIRNNSHLSHVFVAKVLATGDSALLQKIPLAVLGEGQAFLTKWEHDHPPPLTITLPRSEPVSQAEAFLAKIESIDTGTPAGVNALWFLFDQKEAIALRDNQDVAIALVKKDGNLLGRLHRFENDPEVVFEAIKNKPETFRLASDAMKNNGELVYKLYNDGYDVLPFAGTEALMQIAKDHPKFLSRIGDQKLVDAHPNLSPALIYELYQKAYQKGDSLAEFIMHIIRHTPEGIEAGQNKLYDALRLHPDMIVGALKCEEMLPQFAYQACVIAIARDPSLSRLLPDTIKNRSSFAEDVRNETHRLEEAPS